VIAVAIRFDNQPLIAPEKIDEMAADADVDRRRGQAVAPAESEECPLEIASRSIPIFLRSEWETEHIRLPDRMA
jgi:hypothetical protein